jgi:hypothetical protein
MRGIILSFDRKIGKGIISGNDGNRYEFIDINWMDKEKPRVGLAVDFLLRGGIPEDIRILPKLREKPNYNYTIVHTLVVLFTLFSVSFLGSVLSLGIYIQSLQNVSNNNENDNTDEEIDCLAIDDIDEQIKCNKAELERRLEKVK